LIKTELETEHKGSKFTIIHCKGALDSFHNAMKSVDAKRRKSFANSIIHQIKRLANGERMTKENFPQEGNLPKRPGQHNTKKFNALKKIPIRGYCWLSEKHSNTYYISHYVHKDYKRLKERDSTRVENNWKRIEENGDER